MNKYVKSFLFRGLIFGGFGPIIAGIVYLSLSFSIENFALTGGEIFLAIVSVYLLAFIQAGASVFNQIERWSVAKSSIIHLSVIYVAYILCYLVNTWIPFELVAVLIFTGIFVASYFIVWITVFLVMRKTSKALNKRCKV